MIVGAGQAAGQLMASLAQDGFAGDQPGRRRAAPALSAPAALQEVPGRRAGPRPPVRRPAAFYEKAGCRLLLGERVERIDREGRAVIWRMARRCVLDPGPRHRQPAARADLPGALPGVFYLRNIADVAPSGRACAGESLVVVGGGYIGLELAAVAVKPGVGVTVLEQAPR